MSNFDKEFKKVWATLDRIAEERKAEDAARRKAWAAENEARRKAWAEFDEAQRKKWAEFDEAQRKKWAEFDARHVQYAEERKAEDEARRREFDAQIKAINRNIFGYTKSASLALEDEYAAALRESPQVGGILLDDVKERIAGFRYEYDLVGINGKFMFVGEIKHKFARSEVRHFAEERLPHFAKDFPGEARGRKIVGMIGGGHITPRARAEAKKNGLIILRLRNRKLVIENADKARPVGQV